MLVCFFISHARPRVHWAPGFPCALYSKERDMACKPRALSASREYGCMSTLDVIARSVATKQSILSLRGEMDRFAEPCHLCASAIALVGGAHSRDPLARNDV